MGEAAALATLEAYESGTSGTGISEEDRHFLLDKLTSYDTTVPEVEHLRPHQIEATSAFCNRGAAMLAGKEAMQGMSILHPTGSGKTVDAAELMRIVSPLKTLMLVPRRLILNQTIGNDEEIGTVQSFIPNMDIGEYSGRQKTIDASTTVMTYQSLNGAIRRGDIGRINPKLIICDENHHIIDGQWAEDIASISQNRLLVGLTATPAYSSVRDVRRLFPVVLASKTMRQGIEEGILSELRGYVYRGQSRIRITSRGRDYSEEDLFNAIAHSPDNYTAAAICAAEVAQGRRGIVSCVPGFDRAHAKIMAKILSHTPVNTPEGNRLIRAVFIDGAMDKREAIKILGAYRRGEIDVITFVDYLLEGWDSKETDFGVFLRPTPSPVLEEQRMGRLTRPREGKVATIHELLYETDDTSMPQVTHLDILGQPRISQGKVYGFTPSPKKKQLPATQGFAEFNADKFEIDSGLADRIKEINSTPIQDIRVASGQEALPFDWLSSYVLGSRFGIPKEQAEAILSEHNVPFRTKVVDGKEHHYHAPDSSLIIARQLGIEEITESRITIPELIDYAREHLSRRVSAELVEARMAKARLASNLCLDVSDKVVTTYDRDAALEAIAEIHGEYIARKGQKQYEASFSEPHANVANWLANILTNPMAAPDRRRQREIRVGQGLLLKAINSQVSISLESRERLEADIKRLDIKPTAQMRNVMHAKKISFSELLVRALQAKTEYSKVM